jgi:hypothetical protein
VHAAVLGRGAEGDWPAPNAVRATLPVAPADAAALADSERPELVRCCAWWVVMAVRGWLR